MNTNKIVPLIIGLCTAYSISLSQITLDSIPDDSGYTYIASPAGTGPFPSVLYNHGGFGQNVGGDLRGTAVALAQAGYFARCEKRTTAIPIAIHLQEVEAALDALLADPRCDTACVTIMGFSRGGYLTLETAKQNPGKVHGIIAMAPANPIGLLSSLVTDVSSIDDPALILVANNDTFQDQHVMLAQMVYDSLLAGGKTATINIYPDYDSNSDSILNSSDDGHELFFVVQDPYWTDVINFLNSNSCISTGLNNADKEIIMVEIYSNPFSESATLRITNPLITNWEFKIFNVFGSEVKKEIIRNSSEFLIRNRNLAEGIYFIQIKSENFIQNKKLVVIR
ncbi:MAG: T9SS type A sorting domain-containing protein [Bacteroidetes bacterium]|nr:T9SS type A sorting domain-containing protein [Bacteroidota bacterium]